MRRANKHESCLSRLKSRESRDYMYKRTRRGAECRLSKILAHGITTESRILTRPCPNLKQFFIVIVLMLPTNFITIHEVVLELFCKQTNKQTNWAIYFAKIWQSNNSHDKVNTVTPIYSQTLLNGTPNSEKPDDRVGQLVNKIHTFNDCLSVYKAHIHYMSS